MTRTKLITAPGQLALFDVPPSPLHVAVGVVYLMTDWYVLKWGWTGRDTPEQRSGELRASVIGFMAGSRADEDAYKRQFARWCIGGEWFRVPDDPAELHNLWLIAAGLGQWKGVRATEALARVIANNLRRAALSCVVVSACRLDDAHGVTPSRMDAADLLPCADQMAA